MDQDPYDVKLHGFDLMAFHAFGALVAFRTRGVAPVLCQNHLAPNDLDHDWLEAYLTWLDWGVPVATAPRLAPAAFLATWQARLAADMPLRQPPLAGEARRTLAGPSGFALCQAAWPGDAWPGAPHLGSLGRAGYWGGTAARHLWLGEQWADVDRAMWLVQRADLGACGCTFADGGMRPPPVPLTNPVDGLSALGTRPPSGDQRDPFDVLLAAYTTGSVSPPGGELCAVVDGRWIAGMPAACDLCGKSADLVCFGAGDVYLCDACRRDGLGGLIARLTKQLNALADTDPTTLTAEERALARQTFARLGATLERLLGKGARAADADDIDDKTEGGSASSATPITQG